MKLQHCNIKKYNKGVLPLSAKEMILTHHYSKTWRSQKQIYTYEFSYKGKPFGYAVIGQPCGAKVESFYGTKGKVLELRRLVMTPNRPKNAGSYFLSRIIKDLKNMNKYEVLIAYSDPNYGHLGGIYRAANFSLLGEEMGTNPRKLLYKKKKYTMREVYQKLNGEYTKKALELQAAIKSNNAVYCDFLKKIIYGVAL